jgi:hypothetical protein
MPLARIVTRYPEHADSLSQQLQLEGFSVEIAAPGAIHSQPADLEIDFAICNPAEVLQRASRRAAALGADVVVASGVMDLAMQRTAVAPVELQPGEVAETHEQPESMPPAAVEAGPTEAIPAQPIAVQAAAEEFNHELPPYNPHFAANLGTQLRESLAGLGMAATEFSKRLVEHLRNAATGLRSRMTAARINLASAAKSLASRRGTEIASAQAATQELTAANLPVERQQEPQEKPKELGPATAISYTASSVNPLSAPSKQLNMPQLRRTPLQLRGIFIGAAAASALFLVGIVLANLHSQSPLPASMTQPSVEQHVPFGAIIVQGRPAQPRVNGVQPGIVPPHANPQPRENSRTVAPKKPRPYHRSLAAHENDGGAADDVVVRHFSQPVRRPIQQQAGLKRYSDLN